MKWLLVMLVLVSGCCNCGEKWEAQQELDEALLELVVVQDLVLQGVVADQEFNQLFVYRLSGIVLSNSIAIEGWL